MSFLAPLYALAGLAIALPILFHLVRKRPKDRQTFSSLMFLEPAPPRLTQRSRIDNWLLLILRAMALALLAAAFTRPYWNLPSETPVQAAGTRRMFLIDTSASMRREGLFEKTIARTEALIQQSNATDVLAVYAFDRSVRPLVSVDAAVTAAPSQRQSTAIASLRSAAPTWQTTDLGNALTSAADLLQTENETTADTASTLNEIVVITDLQSGMLLDKLASYVWPDSCKVRIERVEPNVLGNSHATFLESSNQEDDTSLQAKSNSGPANESIDPQKVRVRVVNETKTASDNFQLAWWDDQGKIVAGSETHCKVPAGSTLIVRMPPPTVATNYLQLSGDKVDFDNQHFVTRHEPIECLLVCIEPVNRIPENSLGYFVEQLPLGSPVRSVKYESRAPGSASIWPSPVHTPLIIAAHELQDSDFDGLTKYLEQGGQLLWVWDEAVSKAASGDFYSNGLRRLAGTDTSTTVSESSTKGYAMLERIDFQHPLFADLSDSRFNDFTKVRFWSHRKLEQQDESQWQILARFDDGSPALLSQSRGAGMLWVLMSGWQPSQSQFALSSKFVPFISGMFRLAAHDVNESEAYAVGDPITWDADERIVDPNGAELARERDTGTANAGQVFMQQPGIYQRIRNDGNTRRFAVNVAESESAVAVADLERLERLGVTMSDERPAARQATMQRQLRAVELEAQQGWWRWLVIGVIGAVGLESLICVVRTRFV